MRILVTAPGLYLTDSRDEPEPGRRYELVDASDGTARQGRAFHALVAEYFVSGCYSYPAKSLDELRNYVKLRLGAGVDAYVYADMENGKAIVKKVKEFSEIPEHVRKDPDASKLIIRRLKSWTEYSKRERRETLDRLIAQMHSEGVQTKHFFEILEGMEGWQPPPSSRL